MNSAPLFSASNNSSEPMDVNYIAPAFASAETFVEARPEVIWEVLAGIDRWPEWNSDVTRAELKGPLQPGSRFRWKAAGMPIVSTLQTVEPYRKVGWTGRAPGIRAIHVWTIQEAPGGVLVRTEESFEGAVVRILAGLIRSMLASSLEKGLAALKAESERRVKEEAGAFSHQ